MSTIDTDRMASNWINTHYEQKIEESPASIKALGRRPPSSSSSKVTPTEYIEKHGQYVDNNSAINLVADNSKIELSQGALQSVKDDNITINLLKDKNKKDNITKNTLEWSKIFGVNELEGQSDEAILSLIGVSSEHVQGTGKSAKRLARDVNNFILFSKDENGNVEIKPIGVVKAFVKSDIKKEAEGKVSYVEFTAPRNNTIINKPLVNSFNENPDKTKYGPKLTIEDKDIILYNSTEHTKQETNNYLKIQVGNEAYKVNVGDLLSEPSDPYRDLLNDLILVRMTDGSLGIIEDKDKNIRNTLTVKGNIQFEVVEPYKAFIVPYIITKEGNKIVKNPIPSGQTNLYYESNKLLFKYKLKQ
jgi:hypothetical protein